MKRQEELHMDATLTKKIGLSQEGGTWTVIFHNIANRKINKDQNLSGLVRFTSLRIQGK